MKRKNLDVCEDQVRSALALNELGTEQRSKLNRVRKKLNRAKRENRITQEEIFEIVQEIAEALIEFRDAEGRRRSKGRFLLYKRAIMNYSKAVRVARSIANISQQGLAKRAS